MTGSAVVGRSGEVGGGPTGPAVTGTGHPNRADAGWHARQAMQYAGDALRPGVRLRRARVLVAVAQVHAMLATAAAATTASRPPTQAPPAFEPTDRSRSGRRRTRTAPLVAPPAATAAPTLFERLKGQDGIAQVVQEFYTRVLRDPQLTHYFEGVAMWRLQRHMVAFLVQATGGPIHYEGREMAAAHAHLQVTGRDFDRVARHLVETLVDFRLADPDIDEVVAAVSPIRSEIVIADPPPETSHSFPVPT